MDENLRSSLILHTDLITENVYVEFLAPFLIADGILTYKDSEWIDVEKTHYQKAAKLLQVLHTKDSSAFYSFVAALKRAGYEYIAEQLEGLTSGKKVRRLSDADTHSILVEGGVPARPHLYVDRPSQLEKIRGALEELSGKNSGWVVVHGMGGSGKSVLAAESLRSAELISEYYPGGTFWVSVGPIDSSKLLIRMQNLCTRLDKQQRPLPNNLEEAKDRLRVIFAQQYPKSLLVLDDVWSASTVRAFDIQCRILLTTRDKSVTDSVYGALYSVPLSAGLSKEQSLEALGKWTNTDKKDLPEEATIIYRECRGLPLAITMLGALLRDHPNRWPYYLEKLQKRDMSKIKKMLAYEYPTLAEAINMSITSLDDKLQEYYRDFAVFADGMKIPTEVFSTLWDMEVEDVEDMMKCLSDKSLVVQEQREPGSDELVYGVHDLQLDFLKLTCPSIPALHQKLVNCYKTVCKNELWKLPLDGYIHWFITYHLFKARLYTELSSLLLNLRFLEAKLNVTGPAEVLNDYLRYSKVIDHQCPKKRKDFEQFVSVNAHLLVGSDKPDVVQLALCQPSFSQVYVQAREIASTEQGFYLDWNNKASVTNDCLLTVKLHKRAVRFALFTPDGSKVISCAADNVAKLWDAHAGQELAIFKGHKDDVHCCALSRTGQLLVTCSADKTLKMWAIDEELLKKVAVELSESPPINAKKKETSPNLRDASTHPMFLEDSSSADFDLDADTSRHTLHGHLGEIMFCDISHDDRLIVSCGMDSLLKLWDIQSLKEIATLEGHTATVNRCLFFPDDKHVISCSNDVTVIVWEVATKSVVLKYEEHGLSVSSVDVSSNGELVASSGDGDIHIWKALSGEVMQKCYTRSGNAVLCCKFSPDNFLVAGGLSNYSVVLWSTTTAAVVAVYKGHTGWVYSLNFSTSGTRLLSASDDETVMIWKVGSTNDEKSLCLKRDYSVNFAPDNNILLVAPDSKNRFAVLSGKEGEVQHLTSIETSRIRCCAVASSWDFVAFGCDSGVVKLLRLENRAAVTSSLRELEGHTGSVRCCSFGSHLSILVTCSDDCTLRIWPLISASGDQASVLCNGHSDSVWRVKLFNQDSRILSCSHDGSIRVWNSSSGEQLLRCTGHQEWVLACDVSFDEKHFISASVDRTLKLWNTADGKLIHVFTGHSDCVRSCEFSADGQFLVSGDDQGFIFIWLVKQGCLKSVLSRHNSWVTDVHFSKDGSKLVSASDSLKFWDSDGTLLQTFHIRGSFVKYVTASSDFKTFVSVDSAGILYILNQIEDSESPSDINGQGESLKGFKLTVPQQSKCPAFLPATDP